MIAGTGFEIVPIEEVWPLYQERAKRSRSGAEVLDWIVGECRGGLALCLRCTEGIVILSLAMADGLVSGVRVLLVVSSGGQVDLGRHEGDLATVARALGAARLMFRTDRPAAWRRVLGSHWAFDQDNEQFWRAV